jgi:TonB family protein
VAVLLVALTVKLTSPPVNLPERYRAVALTAPVPELKPYVPKSLPAVPPPARLSDPPKPTRTFQPMAVRVVPRPILEQPDLAIPDRPAPTPIAPSLPKVAVAPPPLRTDNLDRPLPLPSPVSRGTIRSGVFLDAETSITHRARTEIEQVGAFGSSVVGEESRARRVIAGAGFGSAETGAANDTRPRVLAKTGFADSAISRVESTRASLALTGFGDASIAKDIRTAKIGAAATPDSPVEILSKSKPAYTEEARRLQLEGEVVLEILFPANGDARVVRIVQGLGHGLDESAIAAAQAIRFKPAQKNHTPVDSMAVVRIMFQLAY